MRKLLLIGLLPLFGCGGEGISGSDDRGSNVWTGTLSAGSPRFQGPPGGDASLSVVIDGNSVTGTCVSQGETGVVSGTVLSLQVDFPTVPDWTLEGVPRRWVRDQNRIAGEVRLTDGSFDGDVLLILNRQ